MSSPRRLALTFVAVGALVTASITVATDSLAQKKPDQPPAKQTEKQTPDPQQKELLTVQPAPVATQTPPADPGQKPSASTKILLPEGGVDSQNAVITNTDLVTFNVTVTDIYGRFVAGLGKNAFSVLDEKAPQEITFFKSVGAAIEDLAAAIAVYDKG